MVCSGVAAAAAAFSMAVFSVDRTLSDLDCRSDQMPPGQYSPGILQTHQLRALATRTLSLAFVGLAPWAAPESKLGAAVRFFVEGFC